MANPLEIDTAGPRATVTLNRPEVHNAFDEALIADVTAAFERLSVDPAVRVIVIAGNGASFCAGADLGWIKRSSGYSREENVADAWRLQRMLAAIADCPKVTIARVHGAAIGGGAGLVAACDMGVASSDARFALSEVRLGLVPAVVGPYVLQKVGAGAARALFVTGRRIAADEALRIGLVHQVAPAAELDAAVTSWAEQAVQAGPQAVVAAKRLLGVIAHMSPEAAASLTVESIADLRAGAEAQEGIAAFLEKRKPNFSV